MLLLNAIFLTITLYCLLGALYYFAAALLFLLAPGIRNNNPDQQRTDRHNRFLILIPAHNEEKVLPRLLDSVRQIEYPGNSFHCCVVCDNCEDGTERVAKAKGVTVLRRNDKKRRGKGYAIEWALARMNIRDFDAVLMTDADTMLDKDILKQLDMKFACHDVGAVQCYNGVINPDDTPFTRLISLARAMEIIYMASRSYLGLTVHLIGNGMCFRSSLLKTYPWTAFSLSEDLEYFCLLSLKGVRVHYSYTAKVFLQEEEKLSDAKTQRQRWSSGRFPLIMRYVPGILWKWLKDRKAGKAEAAMILLVPNPSLLGNLLVAALIFSLFLNLWRFIYLLNFISLFSLFFLFISSFLIVKMDRRRIFSVLLVPVYLVWKGVIDLQAVFGKRKVQWIKTERH